MWLVAKEIDSEELVQISTFEPKIPIDSNSVYVYVMRRRRQLHLCADTTGLGERPAEGSGRSFMRSILIAAAFALPFCGFATSAMSAEAIVGKWKRSNGTVLQYASAGGGKYCGKVLTGEYKGQSIGCMSGSGGTYEGEVIKLDEGKTYTGKASASGSSMKLSGCVLGGVICKTETLTRN